MKPFIPQEDGWSDEKRTTEAAMEYASRGWSVFPCHRPTGKFGCTCGRPDCSRKGKHPKTRRGFKDATRDSARIERWFKRPANVAIATGAGLLVVDIDGKAGEESLSKLEDENGVLPDTVSCVTGSGGVHYYFRVDVSIKSSAGNLGDGIDIRCDGGYVVAPPSLHSSGKEYTWNERITVAALAPQWLIDLCIGDEYAQSEVQTGEPDAVIGELRNKFLTAQAGAMRRRGMSENAILRALLIENEEKCRPPLDKSEVERIARSIVNYPPEDDQSDWGGLLKRDAKTGIAKPTAGNCAIYLTYRPEWNEVLAYNEFTDEIFWKKDPPPAGIFQPKKGDRLEEGHVIYASHWLAKECGPMFNQADVWASLKAIARQNSFDPLKDYLDSLSWDGKPRIENWLQTYLEADGKSIIKQMGKWWLISSVARVYRPGCQVDYTLILEGRQNVGKTTVARILGGDYYLGTLPNLNNQYAALHMQGFWVIEIPELSSLRGASRERVKEFLTQEEDVYKRPYEKITTRRKRRCVFLATTNRNTYLEDDENRRFWPVKIRKLDRAGLVRDRDQLFAEAVHLFKDGHRWHPDMQSNAELMLEQEARFVEDTWDNKIITFLVGQEIVTTADVLSNIGFDLSKVERRHQMRCSDIMKRLGWQRERKTVGGRIQRCWVPTERWKQKLVDGLVGP
jgi:predicted P-loop ATPase